MTLRSCTTFRENRERIDSMAIAADLKMQVNSRRATRSPHFANHMPPFHELSFAHDVAIQVGVEGCPFAVMLQYDHFSVTAKIPPYVDDASIMCGQDVGAARGGQIQSLVRIATMNESAGESRLINRPVKYQCWGSCRDRRLCCGQSLHLKLGGMCRTTHAEHQRQDKRPPAARRC